MENETKAKFNQSNYWNLRDKYSQKHLNQMVYAYLAQENHNVSQLKSKERQEKIKFYPSSIGKSDYDIVLEMMGYVGDPMPGEVIMIMNNGTAFHNRMEDTFEEMGIMVAPELSLKNEELCISGRSDAIIWNFLREEDEPDGEIIQLHEPDGTLIYEGPENYVLLVEFKSIGENGFERLRKSKPNPEHEDQLQLYFHLTGITKGIVYYENKNNQKATEYIVEKDDERIKAIVKRIKYLINCVKTKNIPEPDYTPGDFAARFSKFLNIAHPNSNPVQFDQVFGEETTPSDLPF